MGLLPLLQQGFPKLKEMEGSSTQVTCAFIPDAFFNASLKSQYILQLTACHHLRGGAMFFFLNSMHRDETQ